MFDEVIVVNLWYFNCIIVDYFTESVTLYMLKQFFE